MTAFKEKIWDKNGGIIDISSVWNTGIQTFQVSEKSVFQTLHASEIFQTHFVSPNWTICFRHIFVWISDVFIFSVHVGFLIKYII